MGDLLKIIDEEYKNIPEDYKKNTMFFYDAYQKTSKDVTNLNDTGLGHPARTVQAQELQRADLPGRG